MEKETHRTKQSLETEQSSCLDTRNFSETFPLGRNGRSKKWLNKYTEDLNMKSYLRQQR